MIWGLYVLAARHGGNRDNNCNHHRLHRSRWPYLAQLLLEKGYTVYGTYHRTRSVNFWRIEELGIHNHPNLHLVEYDLTDECRYSLAGKSQSDRGLKSRRAELRGCFAARDYGANHRYQLDEPFKSDSYRQYQGYENC